MSDITFSSLTGLTLMEVKGAFDGNAEVIFTAEDGRKFRQYHYQDCCEIVQIDEVHGDVADLVGSPILLAEEVTYENEPTPDGETGSDDSYTWTFYKLATVKGHVTIKWLGESNGYYSESVDFEEMQA